VKLVTLAFWDAHLRGDAAAGARIHAGTFRPAPDAAEVTVETK
jgi:hypothetical protein